jgi:hypothetical protein
MKSPNLNPLFATCALLAILAACANQKTPAQHAIATAETAVQSVADDASKYLPDRYAELTGSLATIKGNFDKGDYKAVLAAAPSLMAQVKSVGDAAVAKKNEAVNALKSDWTTLASNIPSMVGAIQSRVDILSKAKKLPAKLSAQNFDMAKSGLESIKNTWAQAGSVFSSGDIESAVSMAKSAQSKGQEVLALLGMTQSQSIHRQK